MILRSEELIKFYGRRKVVKGVSIEVRRGEIVGLLGPNGAGKTTTFYMVVGFVKPNGGKVLSEVVNFSVPSSGIEFPIVRNFCPLRKPRLDPSYF